MNRGSAERAVGAAGLTVAEKLMMMMLLRRAHNDTCEVPDWRTPPVPQLGAEVRLDVRRTYRVLAHLERHGWIKRVAGNGRGHKSTYILLPDGVPQPCDCTKLALRAILYGKKGWLSEPGERVVSEPSLPPFPAQVRPPVSARALQGGRVARGGPACSRCKAPISHLRYAQAGPVCVRCAE